MVIVSLILFRMAKELDGLYKFVFGQLSTSAIAALQPHLIVAVLVESLAHEVLKPLLNWQSTEALHRDRLGLLLHFFFVTQLPEPLVDLTFTHFELAGQLSSLLARRHLSFILSKYLAHNLHLLRLLALTSLYYHGSCIFFRTNRILWVLIIGARFKSFSCTWCYILQFTSTIPLANHRLQRSFPFSLAWKLPKVWNFASIRCRHFRIFL